MPNLVLASRYEIIEPLGEGNFGKTFKAKDLLLPGYPLCVVKQLQPFSSKPEVLAVAKRLFNQEARVLQQLGTHPQIPQLFAYFMENEQYYLVEEFVEGSPLSEAIHTGEQWREDQVIDLLREILTPLAFVHQNHVIHRDIKPANLMRREQDHSIVLIDFGAVKEIIAQTQSHSQGTISIGTPGYAPVEQWNGQPTYSSDLYAVGIIAIQLLTGLELKQITVNGSDQSHVTPQLQGFLQKMVSESCSDRYYSAQEALQALNQLTQLPSSKVLPIHKLLGSMLLIVGIGAGIIMGFNSYLSQKPASILPSPTPLLSSDSSSVDYTLVKHLLAAGKWKEADQKTFQLLTIAGKRSQEGWLTLESLANIPCGDIQRINQLWLKYSGGKFGFSVQKKIYLRLKGKQSLENWNEMDYQNYNRFATEVGWKTGIPESGNGYLLYKQLTFDLTAPKGHLPAFDNDGMRGYHEYNESVRYTHRLYAAIFSNQCVP